MDHLVGFVLVLALIAISTWLVLVIFVAWTRMSPPRLSGVKALFMLGRADPGDLGFAYERLQFPIDVRGREASLNSYLVRHEAANGRLVVLLHGFADSSAGAAAWLPMLHECRVNVLLVDLPGHGDSGNAKCTAGWDERLVIGQVLEQMRSRWPADCEKICLFGISMGASVALATACGREDVASVIADSPIADFPSAAVRHAWLFGLPGRIFHIPATWLIGAIYGVRFAEISPMRLLTQAPCPVLLIQAEKDILIDPKDAARMKQMLENRPGSRCVTIAGAHHILGLAHEPERYAAEVRAFLEQTLADEN